MAARTSSRRAGQAPRAGMFAEGFGAFLGRRLVEAIGLAFVVLGGAIVVACVSFNAADPSFNRAVAGPVANLLGRPGAFAAEALLSGLGFGAFLIPLALIAWGWRMVGHWPVRHWWLRLPSLLLGVLLIVTALAIVPSPARWPQGMTSGGVVGGVLLVILAAKTEIEPMFTVPVAASLGLAIFLYSLAISQATWATAGRGVLTVMATLVGAGLSLLRWRPAAALDPACSLMPPRYSSAAGESSIQPEGVRGRGGAVAGGPTGARRLRPHPCEKPAAVWGTVLTSRNGLG